MARILLADDDANFRAACVRLLARAGHDVDPAEDGEEALRFLRKSRYDLVLLDLAMPVLDGPTLLQAMRADPRWAKIPVIVVTALSEDDAARRVQGLNVRSSLIKSRFSGSQLQRKVQEALLQMD